MDDETKAKNALLHALVKISNGLDALRGNSLKSAQDQSSPNDVLRKDFINIVTLIYSYSTRLWIALGKQPPTPSMALPTMEEIEKNIQTLYGCALTFKAEIHGDCLVVEIHRAASETLLSLQALLQGYLSHQSGEEMMRKTAALHEVCEASKGISTNNREAAAKVWKQDSEALKDAIKEVDDLLNFQDGESDEGVDDGWDELLDGEVEDSQLTEEDRVTVRKVLVILEKASAVRKQVRKRSFAEKMDAPLVNAYIDRVVKASKASIPLVDDVVACLDPPLELNELQPLLLRLLSTLDTLVSTCNSVPTDISTDIKSLSIEEVGKSRAPATVTAIATMMTEMRHSIQTI